VTNSVSSVTVTPTTSSGAATVSVDGVTVASGSPSTAIALAVGFNTISVVVTASDPSFTQTYTLTLSRATAVIPPTPTPAPDVPASGGTVPNTSAVTPPVDVVNRDTNGAVLVNGSESVSRLVPNSIDTGWVASMDGLQVSVSMEKSDGEPERMSATGEMQAVQGGRIVVSGSGYSVSSIVPLPSKKLPFISSSLYPAYKGTLISCTTEQTL